MWVRRDQNLNPFPGERVEEAVGKVKLKSNHGLGLITGANCQEGMDLLPLNLSLAVELAFSLLGNADIQRGWHRFGGSEQRKFPLPFLKKPFLLWKQNALMEQRVALHCKILEVLAWTSSFRILAVGWELRTIFWKGIVATSVCSSCWRRKNGAKTDSDELFFAAVHLPLLSTPHFHAISLCYSAGLRWKGFVISPAVGSGEEEHQEP